MGDPALPVGCVVLAAGRSSRFGADKLLAPWGDGTVIGRALDAVPAGELDAVVVVTGTGAIGALARSRGFQVVHNGDPDKGISHTIRLGTAVLAASCAGIVYLPADQPLLRRESVADLIRIWRGDPGKIAALGHGGVRGSPCLFPARLYPDLMSLSGDRGGSALIRGREADLILRETAAEELLDADTPEALTRLRLLSGTWDRSGTGSLSGTGNFSDAPGV